MISRRNFFRDLFRPARAKALRSRLDRYKTLETYVRMDLLPFDSGLTGEEYQKLLNRVRDMLDRCADSELFSFEAFRRVNALVETTLSEFKAQRSTSRNSGEEEDG